MSSLKSGMGRLARRFYQWLPIGWGLKLAVKDKALLLCAPLLEKSTTFQRWRDQGNGKELLKRHAKAASSVVEPVWDEPNPGESSARGVYLSDMFSARATSPGPGYQAITDQAPPTSVKAKAIAFYLPQFHPFKENDEWWGKGFTEWTNVTKAVPQFVGHQQPKLPGELGFYDLRLVDVMRRQTELARLYGVHGFCFHYYWFSGKRLLELPLDQFVANQDIEFPFCLCWANENWTRRWDGQDHDVLMGQNYTHDNDIRFIQEIERYLRDPRYIRIDGKPLLIVYRPSLLPDCRDTLKTWRDHCRTSGLGEIFLAMVQFDIEDPRVLGFDAALEFPPHKIAQGMRPIHSDLEIVNREYAGYVVDYQEVVERSRNWPTPDYSMFRGLFPGWDNEARKPGAGYTFANSTPSRYGEWLSDAVSYAVKNPVAGESVVFINAWNEWAEGAYLEPDRNHGYAYLDATRAVLENPGEIPIESAAGTGGNAISGLPGVVVVSHDAHPHGAQYLSLNLCRELRAMGFPVSAVLLGDGVLESQFNEVATVHKLPTRGGDAQAAALASMLASGGARIALANTAVSGLFAADLERAGLSVVSMVHELPGVIREYSLQEHVTCISSAARRVIFAVEAVRTGFGQFADLKEGQALIRPQGAYKRNRHQSHAAIEAARQAVRAELSLPGDARIILGVGYADLRKGVDLFVEAARDIVADDARNHLVWLGHFDLQLEPTIRERVKALGLEANVHFLGRRADTDDFYAAADLLALTSREDPFPSVLMESLDVLVPVVAFSGTGGAEALLRRGCGVLVEVLEAPKFAEACLRLLGDEAERKRLGGMGKQIVETEFSFRSYVFDLLAAAGLSLPRISVVVPNFNYAHLLAERLRSIATQTIAPFEIIVLDDASTDSSMQVIADLQSQYELRVVANTENSGSVFKQWLKGVEHARGDFVWIAEADDLSLPRFLETAMQAFDDQEVVLSYTESKQMGPEGEILAEHYRDYVADLGAERWMHPYVRSGVDEITEVMAVKNTIPNVSAVLFRRDRLLAVLLKDINEISAYRVAGDWATYVSLLERGNIAFHPEALNLHRRHASGVTLALDNLLHFNEVVSMQKQILRRFSVPATVVSKAVAYESALRKHFCLEPCT